LKERILFIGKMAVFWIAYFQLCRILFFLYHFDFASSLNPKDIVMPMWLGLRMDASMGSYWAALTALLISASPLLKNQWVSKIHCGLVAFLLLLSTLIATADLELYRHWRFRINTTPFFYAGKEGAQSIGPGRWILLLLLAAGLFWVSFFCYKRLSKSLSRLPPLSFKRIPLLLLFSSLLFLPIRGRLRQAPLNTGVVYYHNSIAFANHAGVNAVWNFFRSVASDNDIRYPKDHYSGDTEAQFQRLMAYQNKPPLIRGKPNIILIILESFTSKVIEPLGGRKGVTPAFNKWAEKGILFTNFIASGDRTEKGIAAILSGYPAQPRTSIVKFPEKTQSLPFLPATLKKAGYNTGFLYGGEIGFANMESYVTTAGFDRISDVHRYPVSIRFKHSSWGVSDEFVFDQLLKECDEAASPFFETILTLSSHEPYAVPMKTVFEGDDAPSKFLNACRYTSQCLDRFLAAAEQRPWWKNTWVIITADHGHNLPDTELSENKKRFAIPMLWLGGALNQTGKEEEVAGQIDIAATVAEQLHIKSPFAFSRNVVSSRNPFAIYAFNNGYGCVSQTGEAVYDFDLHGYLGRANRANQDTLTGPIFMQKLFNDYNNR